MKTLVVCYSFTGNNGRLASALASTLNADLEELQESKKRNVLTILLDVLFNRTPKIQKPQKQLENYDHLIFVAPVWFGKIATPLRSVFQNLKDKAANISLIALSAGTHGVNPNLEKEIKQRTGIAPKTVINPLVTELLPSTPKPSPKDVDAYRITANDAHTVTERIVSQLK